MSADVIQLYPSPPATCRDDDPPCFGCGAEPATPDPDVGGYWCAACAALNSDGEAA